MSVALDFLDVDETIDFGPAPTRADAREGVPAHRLLAAIGSEVATLSGPTAAVASLLNGIASPEHWGRQDDALAALLPPEPVVYRAVLASLAAADIEPALFGSIQHFYMRLDHARRATRALAVKSAHPPRIGLPIDALADAWSDLCLAALGIIDRVEEHEAVALDRSVRLPELRAALTLAGAGGSPCIAADGSIEIPGIVERRRNRRHPVAWTAWLQRGEVLVPIDVTDVSTGGIGARVEHELAPGEAVVVLLRDRELTAWVAWATRDRAGLAFEAALAPDDPILAAARAEAFAGRG